MSLGHQFKMSRSKRILKLCGIGEERQTEKRADAWHYEFDEPDNNPWEEYTKWQNSRRKSNEALKRAKSPDAISETAETNYMSSSMSWIPNNSDLSDTDADAIKTTCSTNTSDSEIIKKNKLQNHPDKMETRYDINFSKENKSTENANQINLYENCNSKKVNTENEHAPKIIILNNELIRPAGPVVEVSHRKGRVWNKRDRCLYCNSDITNFSRHLFRKHFTEKSIIEILKLRKGSVERKHSIDLLRKQGNLSIHSEKIIRPVQRPTSSDNRNNDLPHNYLPCKYCMGLYKKNSLGRHAKKCFFNNERNKSKIRFASEGQTILAFTGSRQPFLNRLRLKEEIFNTMRADRISFNGQNDPIVCQYAEDILRKSKRPQIKNLVSNKIRELGRLLTYLQDVYNIHSLLEALKPEHFDKVVAAARMVVGYDQATKSFTAPSLALHFRTILLAVCAAAKTLIIKRDPVLPVTDYEKVLKELKHFYHLVESNWKFEMGSLALKDLTEKHSTRRQNIPITKDVILFKNHCHEVAKKCINILRENVNNIAAFKQLSEVCLVLTILLNRKRVGDVQYLKLETYLEPIVNVEQEECLNFVSESEKVLCKYFKRVVTLGKGSKAVPILFPGKIQEYIEVILEVRNKTKFVSPENPYLFALTGSDCKWINGSSKLRKYALSSGAQYPETLTSSRLRKQIATVLQILNLNEIEMEQIAKFMGHTKKTHEEFYRLPQDVYQTTKIAKLLLMVEKGITKEHEGKTLEEIDIELAALKPDEAVNVVEGEKDSQSKDLQTTDLLNKPSTSTETGIKTYTELNSDDLLIEPSTSTQMKSKSRGTWTKGQKNIILKYFQNHVKNKIAPKKHECLNFKEKHVDMFGEKSWVHIKTYVYNAYRPK